ncbi:unnamed protein product [Darwinula stevensoni]|uniref:DH domain-containing protein n=1 Tax=Darwinula stevensoni TaxID=69355 RepID=A0A7R8XDK9_9CRUS|nr:unnamed protein product [Darwinula stevensoni]CAG0886934.1 unnamed protein product [Darwinula stevensoni]
MVKRHTTCYWPSDAAQYPLYGIDEEEGPPSSGLVTLIRWERKANGEETKTEQKEEEDAGEEKKIELRDSREKEEEDEEKDNRRESGVYEDIEGSNCSNGGEVKGNNCSSNGGEVKGSKRRTLSSDADGDSWGSPGTESSSDGEPEVRHPHPGGDSFRARILRSRTSKTRWKEKKRAGTALSHLGTTNNCHQPGLPSGPEPIYQNDTGRSFTRWFSWRKDSQVEKWKAKKMRENGTDSFLNVTFHRRHQAPSLPPQPGGLSPEQVKRRHIVASIVHSENSYVASVQRLVKDFKKPLEESNPGIISSSKIQTLFYRIPEILQIHTLFRIALSECIRNWDSEESIGDVFVASFSKAIVLDIYSDFINNFSQAMDLARQEASRKSAFADFLKVKQITSPDRLSFFGLMVKPVQRFPQFILQLQDLLKHTPHGHHDRLSLQLALTQLESLAELLNERKREAEQFLAFRETLRHLNSKFSLRSIADGNRFLLREDNMTQLEFNNVGLVTKTKPRRLYLLNDLLVCVSVSPKEDFNSSERLTLKWAFPVSDLEVQDTSTSPTLSRVLTAGLNRSGSLKSEKSSTSSGGVESLCQEMSELMHDFEIVRRVATLIPQLKGKYQGLSVETTQAICASIQKSIQEKDAEIAWVDSCCLQFVVKSKGKEEQFTFQTDNPGIKRDWVIEMRLAQLALDGNNSPAWDIPEQEQRPSARLPLFVRSLSTFASRHQTEVRCGCYYTVPQIKPVGSIGHASYLWVSSSDGVSSHLTIYLHHNLGLRQVLVEDLEEVQVSCMEHVPGFTCEQGLKGHLVWLGTHSQKILVYSALEPERLEQLELISLAAPVRQIKYHCDVVLVALAISSIVVFKRDWDGEWMLKEALNVALDESLSSPVSCLLPISTCIYAACDRKVSVVDCLTLQVLKSFSVQHEHAGEVNLLAHSGIGLWISMKESSTICLYHTETFKHLQDINVASNVNRILGADRNELITVTALVACRGLLWVGTNVGIALTIPLPRLEGVPIISGRANISYHAHFGPITFLLPLQSYITHNQTLYVDPEHVIHEEEERLNKKDPQLTKKGLRGSRGQFPSPDISAARRRTGLARSSKTLPKGLGLMTVNSSAPQDDCDVYGLYGELMNIRNYEEEQGLGDPIYESLRRSDPDLAGLPVKVTTLDRRLQMKTCRPRSLDLSNWSMDSKNSNPSSGSEDGSVSRVPSFNASTPSSSCKSRYLAMAPAETRRTLITVMGGRGYVNLRKPGDKDAKTLARGSQASTLAPKVNARDAHIVMWELKV